MTELPKITCACGFEVVGADEQLNAKAHVDHVCTVTDVDSRWYDAVFSLWGAVIVGLIAVGIPAVIEAATR